MGLKASLFGFKADVNAIPCSRRETAVAGTAEKTGGLTSPTLVLSEATNGSDCIWKAPIYQF